MLNLSNQQDRTYLFRHMKVFPHYVQDYFKSKLHSLSPSTLRIYAIDFEDFFEWLIEEGITDATIIQDVPLTTLEVLEVKQIEKGYVKYLNSREYRSGRRLKGEKLQEKTLNGKISALKSLFYWLSSVAKDENSEPLLKHNVMEQLDFKQRLFIPKDAASKIRHVVLWGKEIDEFRNFVLNEYDKTPGLNQMTIRKYKENKERDHAIISLMLETGITVEEAVNINLSDLDLNRKTLKVSRRSGKSIVLTLTEKVVIDLELYLRHRVEYEPPEEQNTLFLTKQQAPGQSMTKRAIQNMIEKYSEAFGRPNITAHVLRYSFATRHYSKFKDLEKLQEIMGHSDIRSTEVYAYIVEEYAGDVLYKQI